MTKGKTYISNKATFHTTFHMWAIPACSACNALIDTDIY